MRYEYYKSAVKKFGNTRYFDILNNIYTAALRGSRTRLQEDTGNRETRIFRDFFVFFLKKCAFITD